MKHKVPAWLILSIVIPIIGVLSFLELRQNRYDFLIEIEPTFGNSSVLSGVSLEGVASESYNLQQIPFSYDAFSGDVDATVIDCTSSEFVYYGYDSNGDFVISPEYRYESLPTTTTRLYWNTIYDTVPFQLSYPFPASIANFKNEPYPFLTMEVSNHSYLDVQVYDDMTSYHEVSGEPYIDTPWLEVDNRFFYTMNVSKREYSGDYEGVSGIFEILVSRLNEDTDDDTTYNDFLVNHVAIPISSEEYMSIIDLISIPTLNQLALLYEDSVGDVHLILFDLATNEVVSETICFTTDLLDDEYYYEMETAVYDSTLVIRYNTRLYVFALGDGMAPTLLFTYDVDVENFRISSVLYNNDILYVLYEEDTQYYYETEYHYNNYNTSYSLLAMDSTGLLYSGALKTSVDEQFTIGAQVALTAEEAEAAESNFRNDQKLFIEKITLKKTN